MRTRLCSLIQSPDANEGAPTPSLYSTKRSPITALLFEAKQKVLLPVVRSETPQVEDENEDQRGRQAGRSLQE